MMFKESLQLELSMHVEEGEELGIVRSYRAFEAMLRNLLTI